MRILTIAAIAVTAFWPKAVPFYGQTPKVPVVDNSQPGWSAREAPTLSAEPVLIIGTRDERPYQLSRVAGAIRLRDGTIVVADGGSLQLRFFDSAGQFIRGTGQRGDGPGDFRSMLSLSRCTEDSFVVNSMNTA